MEEKLRVCFFVLPTASAPGVVYGCMWYVSSVRQFFFFLVSRRFWHTHHTAPRRPGARRAAVGMSFCRTPGAGPAALPLR